MSGSICFLRSNVKSSSDRPSTAPTKQYSESNSSNSGSNFFGSSSSTQKFSGMSNLFNLISLYIRDTKPKPELNLVYLKYKKSRSAVKLKSTDSISLHRRSSSPDPSTEATNSFLSIIKSRFFNGSQNSPDTSSLRLSATKKISDEKGIKLNILKNRLCDKALTEKMKIKKEQGKSLARNPMELKNKTTSKMVKPDTIQNRPNTANTDIENYSNNRLQTKTCEILKYNKSPILKNKGCDKQMGEKTDLKSLKKEKEKGLNKNIDKNELTGLDSRSKCKSNKTEANRRPSVNSNLSGNKSFTGSTENKSKESDADAEKNMIMELRKANTDYRRFKARYNNNISQVLRNWMSLLYCILILRLNLLKFVLDKTPESPSDTIFKAQILLEGKTVYDMIRKAQCFSHERSLYLWTNLQQLLDNRLLLKTALDDLQTNDNNTKDWKTAEAKLNLLKIELEKTRNIHSSFNKTNTQIELETKNKLAELEEKGKSMKTLIEELVAQITEYKKREVQMRGKILVSLKKYKDLKTKRKYLVNVEKEINELKLEQNSVAKKYEMTIKALLDEIEEKEKEIAREKEESSKLEASLKLCVVNNDGQQFVAAAGN